MNTPKIRFKGFTDDWEQRKLGEVSSKITKKNQDIVVDEVFTNSAEYGIISQRDFFDKDIANLENIDGYYIVEPNDFVYNPRISTTAPFGPIKRNKLERTGAMSPLYYVFRPHDIDLSYLECFFQTSCWHTFMRFNGNTGARSDRFAITDKVFGEMPISMPQDIEEQQKIGSYFSSLDNLITLHQRKCDETKELKKFMLQKMFPKNGEKNPEIRFEGFTDDWEQRKLCEVATFINGRAYSQDELLNSGKYKVLRVGNFYTNDSWYYSDMELDDKYYAKNGDLLYTWSATFGPHIWHGDKVIYHYHIWKIELSRALKKSFALQLLEQDKQAILSDKNGSTMVHITKAGMEGKKVILPSNIEEQAKIGEYFTTLDHLITLHQRKCEKLKELKKFMLQNMFV